MPKEPILIFTRLLVLSLLLSYPLADFAQKNDLKMPRYGGTLRVKSFEGEFRSELDPASPESYIFISEHLYDGLVKLDKNLSPVPSLAEYWIISADGTEYTFHLRKGVFFHHRRELTAEDVKYSLERIIDRETKSPYSEFFTTRVVGAQDFRNGDAEEVRGFKVKDKYIFEIQWAKPYISALYLLSMPFCKILPKELVMSRGKRFFSKPYGTGAFKFHYWIRSPQLEIVGIRLERNNVYFGGKPYVDALEFSPYYTLDHFLEKEVDIIPVLSEKVLTDEYQVFKDGSLNQSFLGMSCNIHPLDKQVVRRALSHGINKSAIARAAYNIIYLYELTHNYIPSKLPGFFPLDNRYGYDPDKAMQLLREAGFSEETQFPALTLFLELPRSEEQSRIYREVRDQCAAMGIRLRVRYYKSLDEVKNSKEPYLVMLKRVTSFPDAEKIIRPLFSSGSPFNVCNYSNPELDRLLEEAESTKSWTNRIKLFQQMEEILVSDVPAIPLFTNQQRIAVQPYVRKVEVPLLGFYYLDASKVWLDK